MINIKVNVYLLLLFAGFSLLPSISKAQIVDLNITSKITATADYREGKTGFPAVILIHGFLQTRESPTIRRLADELASNGYTTLSPTLTLGITKRAQSLGCEAIHKHIMEDDKKEISLWVEWLNSKKQKNIVLIGHSRANNVILSYLNETPDQSVKKGILISLPDDDFTSTAQDRQKMVAFAKQNLKNSPNTLAPYKIAFCDKYMATPESYLSFFGYSRNVVLNSIKTSKKPIEVILGNKDERMMKDWPDQVKESGASISVINDANHFFSDQAEFELNDVVMKSLRSLQVRR
ncbi:alpha/beta fold hydrolase [Sulfurirhabdus autotrophica]|uniref:Dienelactone hydrolase n=1 Tax=Sulfurirhabdus autotrophica TaxID=1706046 RepID=A0A4R3YH85_9PROT|nr:alpha/beta fold hydrolase [Sulfurirhabdus autotrophica]TCV90334.1 dienelactone hydrolase [Sulfurirhabdus autotrophica]